MYFHIVNRYSVLQTVVNANFHSRLFHLTFNNSIRRVTSKYSVDDSDSNFYKENIDLSQIAQKSFSNFLGIESDEGVIVIKPTKCHENSFHPTMCRTDVKKVYKEKYYRTSFGVIRQDSDNKLNFHGQFENKVDTMFPHKSVDDSEVSSEFYKLKSNALSILYKDPFDNSKPRSHISESVSSAEILTDNLHTVNSIDENENKMCDLKEPFEGTPKLSYFDECFFDNLVEKGISNENAVKNTTPDEELNYLDKAFFNHDINTKNSIPHQKVQPLNVEANYNETKPKEEISNENINPAEELNYVDKTFFEPSKNSVTHSEIKNFKNSVLNDQLILDGNKSINFSVKDKSGDMLALRDSKHFIHKQKPKSVNDSNFASKNRTASDRNTHVSKVPFENNLKINNFPNNDHLQFDNFQQSEMYNSVLNSKTDKNVSKNISDIEKKMNNEQLSKSSTEIYLNSNMQSHNAKSYFPSNNRHVEKTKSFAKTITSERDIANQSTESDKITTAHDFVEKLRKENRKIAENGAITLNAEKLDSKGFRILKNQVLDLSYCTRDEVITILKNNILYSDDDLIVLNKPYGLVIHDSQTTKSICLSELLDDLAKVIDWKRTDPKLYTVHRLDKETTGCLLLSKNKAMAEIITSLFSQRKIIKKYFILTSRIPEPLQGIIDIPVAEGSIDSRKRMVLQPHLSKDTLYQNHSKGGKQAVTHYKVLSVSGNAALVEATPETGIKHQIRVHFGFGLSCPILGDHKYSHLDKLAPQKLPSDLLQRLHVRQSKVRHIPMHLHAQSVTIPGYLDGRDLYVTAPLPDHMIQNLKRLGFKKKNKLNL